MSDYKPRVGDRFVYPSGSFARVTKAGKKSVSWSCKLASGSRMPIVTETRREFLRLAANTIKNGATLKRKGQR